MYTELGSVHKYINTLGQAQFTSAVRYTELGSVHKYLNMYRAGL